MGSQIAGEQISRKIDGLRWKKCPSRVPEAPKVHVEAEILTHFGTVDKATALDDLATAVFTEMPDGFEKVPLGMQHEIPLRPREKEDGLTAYLLFFGGEFWLGQNAVHNQRTSVGPATTRRYASRGPRSARSKLAQPGSHEDIRASWTTIARSERDVDRCGNSRNASSVP